MDRNGAIELVKKYVNKPNLVKHMLATGVCMKYLARRLGEDEALWEIAGILHDIDYERTVDNPELHGFESIKILRENGFENEGVFNAILAHCGKKERVTKMEKAIYAVDPTTGFIVACALMHPSKSIDGLDIEFLNKRFKEKRFAAGASREQMKSIEELGITLDEFFQISLDAMRSIKDELSL